MKKIYVMLPVSGRRPTIAYEDRDDAIARANACDSDFCAVKTTRTGRRWN